MNIKSYKHTLFIIVAGCFIYWPISFFLFGVKNDILTDYFPTRFFISESLQSGFFPLWNPYVNFGIPQYTEMNSSFWNPITWLIAGFPGYSIYSIQAELVIYILLGGTGMYNLGKHLGWRADISLLAAICYMGSGFFTGQIQHFNWIAPAGFLPWCILSLKRLLEEDNLKTSIIAGLFFYLYISSAHPGLIIGGFYFFGIIFITGLIQKIKDKNTNIIFLSKKIIVFTVFLAMLSIGILYSYTEVLPFITHAQKPDLTFRFNTTTFQSWLSFLLPAITNKGSSFFQNDISLRNCFIGIIPILFLAISVLIPQKKNRLWWFSGLFFLYLSSDLPFSVTVRNQIPLIGFVRLNAVFRLFALISFLIIGVNSLQHFIQNRKRIPIQWKCIFIGLAIAFIIIFLYGIFNTNSLSLNPFLSGANLSNIELKGILDSLDIFFFITTASATSLTLLIGVGYSLGKMKWEYLLYIGVFDVFLAVNMQLPYTGVGTLSPKHIQSIIQQSPDGIPVPNTNVLADNNYGAKKDINIIGHWSYYNKQIGTLERAAQPIVFKSEFEIFSDSSLEVLSQKPFVYFNTESGHQIIPEIKAFNPNYLRLKLSNHNEGELTLLYKKYLHWKVFLNGIEIQPNSESVFIQLHLPKNASNSIVEFEFKPKKVIFFLYLNLIILIISMIMLVIYRPKTKTN